MTTAGCGHPAAAGYRSPRWPAATGEPQARRRTGNMQGLPKALECGSLLPLWLRPACWPGASREPPRDTDRNQTRMPTRQCCLNLRHSNQASILRRKQILPAGQDGCLLGMPACFPTPTGWTAIAKGENPGMRIPPPRPEPQRGARNVEEAVSRLRDARSVRPVGAGFPNSYTSRGLHPGLSP